MTHDELVARVVVECERRRLYVAYWPDSRRATARGWPDLTILGPRGMIFREVKTGGARPSPEQTALGYALKALGHDWSVWREKDWACGLIAAELDQLGPARRAPEDTAAWLEAAAAGGGGRPRP